MKNSETEKSALQLCLKVMIYLTFGFSIAAVGAYIADLSINSIDCYAQSNISLPFAIVTAAFLLVSLVLFIFAKKYSGLMPFIIITAVLFICCAVTEIVCAFLTRSNLKVLPTVFEIFFFTCIPFLFKLRKTRLVATIFYEIAAIVGVLFMHVFSYKIIGLFFEASALFLLQLGLADNNEPIENEDKPFTVPFYVPLIFVLLSIFTPVIVMFNNFETGVTLFSCLQALTIIIFYLSKNGSKHKIAEYIIFGISVLSNLLTIIPYHLGSTPIILTLIFNWCNILGVIYTALFFENKFKNNVTGIIVVLIVLATILFLTIYPLILWRDGDVSYTFMLMFTAAAQYIGYIALSITETDRVLKRKSAQNYKDNT